MKPLLIAGLVLALPLAHAEFMTGNALLSDLKGSASEHLFAQGYVSGVFDAGLTITHCPPKSITLGQIVDMTKRRLEDTPETPHQSADVLILNMLKATWPCAKKPATPNT